MKNSMPTPTIGKPIMFVAKVPATRLAWGYNKLFDTSTTIINRPNIDKTIPEYFNIFIIVNKKAVTAS